MACINYLIIFGVVISVEYTLSQITGLSREYCMESFAPKCEEGAVIFMEKALYGRMKVGKCITSSDNTNNCFKDDLAFFDGQCSGRLSCDIFIPNVALTNKQSCLKGLLSYLEASYSCLKVYSPPQERCISPEHISVKKKPGFIASITSTITSCGLHGSPWILQAEVGQKIKMRLIDFSWRNDSMALPRGSRCNTNFGYILDMQSDEVINICDGGTERMRHLYLSTGHSVQLVLEASVLQSHYFSIEYEAEGCPDYLPPKYSWIQHENDTIVIQCEHSDNSWKMKCVDNIWLGVVGECATPPTTMKVEEVKPVRTGYSKGVESKSHVMNEVSDNHVTAFGFGCATMIICCSVVFLGVYCTKRYEVQTLQKISELQKQQRFQPTTMRSVRTSISYKPSNRGIIPAGTLELPPYSFPIPKESRTHDLPQRISTYNGNSDNLMMRSMAESDYLAPQTQSSMDEDDNSVQYWVLENPADCSTEVNSGQLSDEMYQSIKLNNSLSSKKA